MNPRRPSPVASTLGTIAFAFALGLVGAYALDLHGHTCVVCGYRWRHLGAFNLGDPTAHACARCGVAQWVKNGPWTSTDVPSAVARLQLEGSVR